MVNQETVIWPLRIFAYIAPHRYMIPTLLYSDFGHVNDWGGAELCPVGTT